MFLPMLRITLSKEMWFGERFYPQRKVITTAAQLYE